MVNRALGDMCRPVPQLHIIIPSRSMRKPVVEIHELIGEEISAVVFVRDYVEFHFGGPVLRSLSDPVIVTDDGVEHHFPEPGSRDALCRVIGSTVRTVDLEDDHRLEMTTSDGSRITIPLDFGHRQGPEAMHFVPEQGGIQVW